MSHRNKLFFLFFPLILIACSGNSEKEISAEIPVEPEKEQQLFFHYPDEFSPEEKAKMEEWVTVTTESAQRVLGQYPFNINYQFHRRDSSYQAVIFGHTSRNDSVHGVDFYVDPSYPLEDFMNYWIGPHEISHLAIPRLGPSNRWFFEGFATYMSREIMTDMGILTRAETDSINFTRICEESKYFTSSSKLQKVTDSLVDIHHLYHPVYWIGVSYFHQAEKQLAEAQKLNLSQILSEFQICCHEPVMNIQEVIAAWDNIAETTIFSDLYSMYTQGPANQLLTPYQ